MATYEPLLFQPSSLLRRLFRTRLLPWLYGPHLLTAYGRVPQSVWKAAAKFKPDLVFTIAGSWDYSALVAQQVARQLRKPLVASFNDWFNYGWFPAKPIYKGMIERRFRNFYRESDLALCTSEGMHEALGEHPNAHILYPIGAPLADNSTDFIPFFKTTRNFIVAFAGSLGDWYGPMMENLVKTSEQQALPLEFRIYGGNPAWSQDFHIHAKTQNIYRGHLPFEKLRQEIHAADALILPMGFGDECAQVERTSFKTKFLDYLSYQKPIVVWGPDYCSASRVAREFDSADICNEGNASACLKIIIALRESPNRQINIVANARKMYDDRFHPDKIHSGLVSQLRALFSNDLSNSRNQQSH